MSRALSMCFWACQLVLLCLAILCSSSVGATAEGWAGGCEERREVSESGADVVESRPEFADGDVGVVEGAVAAVGEQLVQRRDAGRVRGLRALEHCCNLE